MAIESDIEKEDLNKLFIIFGLNKLKDLRKMEHVARLMITRN
jgi:hypothetical protein